MYSIADLKRITGFTDHQVRDRLARLSETFPEDLRQGPRGKILAGDRILAALKRLAELERDGLSAKDAEGQVLRELGDADGNGRRDIPEAWGELLQEKDLRIKTLEERISGLERDKTYLQEQLARALSQLEELQHRALPPAPGSRRRWWWPWRLAK